MAAIDRPDPEHPRAGLVYVAGAWRIRRHGLLTQRELTCIHGHRVRPGLRPFEVAVSCDSLGEPFRQGGPRAARCTAQLYLFTTRARLLWVMDVTAEESQYIADHNMDVAEIINHFGLAFPAHLKINP